MEVQISDFTEYEKMIEVEVPYDDLKPKFEDSYKKYKKTIQLEGFRKGKVPLGLIKKVFGAKIEQEVAENSVSDYLQDVINEYKIKFHNVQKVESLEFNKESGLAFKAIVRVEPEISLKKYKGLSLEKEIYKVTDDDINLALENLREQHATMNNIDSEAQQGNYIVADLQKTDGAGHPLIGEKYENRYFQLSGDKTDENITKQLLGVKSGDTRQISVPSSQNEQNGEEFFSVEVKEVKEKILPELDDEFAKDLGDYENLSSLKDTLRENIEKQAQAGSKQKFHKEIMDRVIKNNPIDLPDFLVDDFLNAFVENIKAENKQNIDNKDIKEQYRADAIWNLKWLFIREKISETEEIKVEESDVDAYIEQKVKDAGKEAAKVRKYFKIDKNRKRVSRELSDQKVMDFIAEKAKIKEKIVTHKEQKEHSY